MRIRLDTTNAESPCGTKIHHVRLHDMPASRYTLLCTPFDLAVDGHILGWKQTKKSVTCKHCIKRKEYYENLGRIEKDQTHRS